jgi:hypothetical protein
MAHVDPKRINRHASLKFVIPAPLAREAGERDQAGTQTAQ